MSRHPFLVGLLVISGILAVVALATFEPEPSRWRVDLGAELWAAPVAVGHEVIQATSEGEVIKLNAGSGNITGRISLGAKISETPVTIGDRVLICDHQGRLTVLTTAPFAVEKSFQMAYVPTLGDPGKPEIPTLLLAGDTPDTLLVRVARNRLARFDPILGETLWEIDAEGPLIQVHPGPPVLIVSEVGGAPVLSAWSAKDGESWWTHPRAVDRNRPFAIEDWFVFATIEGIMTIVERDSGRVVYSHSQADGMIAGVYGDRILRRSIPGHRIESYPIGNGATWGADLLPRLIGVFDRAPDAILVDEMEVRCIDGSNGSQRWQRRLGMPFSAWLTNDVLYVVYKDDFLARKTQLAALEPSRGTTLWNLRTQGNLLAPLPMREGVIVSSRTGVVRLMPHPGGRAPDTGLAIPVQPSNASGPADRPPSGAVVPRGAVIGTPGFPAPAFPVPTTPVTEADLHGPRGGGSGSGDQDLRPGVGTSTPAP